MLQLKRAFGAPEDKIGCASCVLALVVHGGRLWSSWPCWLSHQGEMLGRGVTPGAPDPQGPALQIIWKAKKLTFSGTSSLEMPHAVSRHGAGNSALPLPAISRSRGGRPGLPSPGNTVRCCFPGAGFWGGSHQMGAGCTEIAGREAPCHCPC